MAGAACVHKTKLCLKSFLSLGGREHQSHFSTMTLTPSIERTVTFASMGMMLPSIDRAVQTCPCTFTWPVALPLLISAMTIAVSSRILSAFVRVSGFFIRLFTIGLVKMSNMTVLTKNTAICAHSGAFSSASMRATSDPAANQMHSSCTVSASMTTKMTMAHSQMIAIVLISFTAFLFRVVGILYLLHWRFSSI